MKRYRISTSSVTYAIKTKDLLRRNGFKATVERSNLDYGKKGCSYSVVVEGNLFNIQNVLRNVGVKINEITEI